MRPTVSRWLIACVALATIVALWGLTVWGQTKSSPSRGTERNGTIGDFGAVGDGQTDDTAAIQKAVDSKLGSIRLPAGAYKITAPIVVNLDEVGFTSFTGDGVARLLMAGPGPAIRFVGTHGGTADPESVKANVFDKQRMPRVSGLEIVGAHADADGIEATGTMQLTIDGVNIRDCRHGVHLVQRNRNVLITGSHIYHNRGVGIYLDHVNLHQTNIVGSHISYCGGGGVVVRGGEVRNVHITGCDIESNMVEGGPVTANVLFDSTEGSMAEGAIVGCTIQHNRKGPDSANIRIVGKGKFKLAGKEQDVKCGHITIADNVLSDIHTNIHLAGARGVTILGNTFWQGYSHNLLVEDSLQVVVGANAMERNPLYGYTDEAKNDVVFRRCQDCTITGLHLHDVRDCPAGMTLEDCRRMHVNSCTILDCQRTGLSLQNVTDSTISGNMIRDDRPAEARGVAPASIPLKVVGGGGNWIAGNLLHGKAQIDPASGVAEGNYAGRPEPAGGK